MSDDIEVIQHPDNELSQKSINVYISSTDSPEEVANQTQEAIEAYEEMANEYHGMIQEAINESCAKPHGDIEKFLADCKKDNIDLGSCVNFSLKKE